MKNRLLKILLFSLLATYISYAAFAEIKVELKPSASTLLLGDEITLQLKVDGAQRDVTLKNPEVEGLTFRQLGRPSVSSQTIIINGKVNSFSGLVYNISVSADKTGSYVVPGFEVIFGGKSFITEGFRLLVKEPGQQSKMKVTIDTDKSSYYWQEPVTVILKWYLQDDIEDYGFRFPLLAQKKQLNVTLKDQTATGTTSNLNVEGFKVPFLKSSENLNGETYAVYQARFIVIPTEPGPFHISAASVKAMIQEGTELKRDFFGRTVRTPKLKKIFAASKPKQISIKPLPTKNRPSSFTGAVGRFQINTSIENTQVKVGDPVELSIKISGEGRYESIEPPLLTENREFADNFSINTNLQPGDILQDGVLFKQVIRPKHDNISRIPSIRFSFFNPLLDTFQTIESKPIPLKVLATGRVKKEDVIVNGGTVNREVQSFTREEKGIFANYLFEDALISQTLSWHWILLLVCPPVIYLCVLAIGSRKLKLQNNASLFRAKAAKRIGSRRLKQAQKLIGSDGDEFFLELSQALRGYVADKLNLGAGEVTTVDIKGLENKGLFPENVSKHVIDFLDELDRHRFTKQESSAEEHNRLFESASQLMQELDKKIK